MKRLSEEIASQLQIVQSYELTILTADDRTTECRADMERARRKIEEIERLRSRAEELLPAAKEKLLQLRRQEMMIVHDRLDRAAARDQRERQVSETRIERARRLQAQLAQIQKELRECSNE